MPVRQTMTAARPLRVLIVEDETRLRELLVDVLPDMGYTASSARSAEEAWKLLESESPDIILLDLLLPGEGGMEFFHRLRQSHPTTQVIIMTGHGDLDVAREAIRLDVVDFIRKPCHLREVEDAMERARRRASANGVTSNPPGLIIETTDPPAQDTGTLAEMERQHIMAALDRHNGNRTAAAADLGISRRTLHYRLREYRKRRSAE
jgi:DNA-binding NtrC family response regulator